MAAARRDSRTEKDSTYLILRASGARRDMHLIRQISAAGRRTALTYYVLLAVVLSCGLAQAQQTPPSSKEAIAVNYVLVPFVAFDGKGRPIQDLEKKDVRLYVDGMPVGLDMFERAYDAPVSFTILLDISGSMALAGKMEGARTAINTLLGTRRRGDDFALWAFADGEVEEIVAFTQNITAIMNGVLRLHPYGKTAFHDALARIPDKTILGQNGSRAIILLTDALDNASTIGRDELKRILESVDVPIYPLGLRPRSVETDAPPSPEYLTDVQLLSELARVSGGRAVITTDQTELQYGIAGIQKDLRSQYLIGFAPTGRGTVRFRRISLKIPGRDRVVRVRAGYKGTEPPPILAGKKNSRNSALNR